MPGLKAKLPDAAASTPVANHSSTRNTALVETILAGLVLASVALVAWQFLQSGYFPHPFQADPARSLMDLYNTAYWAHRDGAYSVWHTVYPPLSFVFLRLVTLPQCYDSSALVARGCDGFALVSILFCYGLNAILVFLSYRKNGLRTAVPRTIAICASIPMLYGLELANLIIPCFTFFVLAHGQLIRSKWLTALFEAVAINFKLYLAVVVLPRLILRRWRCLSILAAMCAALYIATFAMLGTGSPFDIARDLMVYAREETGHYAELNHLAALSQSSHNLWIMLFAGPIRLGQLAIVLCCAVALFVPENLNPRRAMALILTFVSAEAAMRTHGHSADYTQIFLLFLVFSERWSDAAHGVLLCCAYLLCLSADYLVLPVYQGVYESYFGQRTVVIEQGLTLGQFLRPVILLIMQYALIAVTAKDLGMPKAIVRSVRRIRMRLSLRWYAQRVAKAAANSSK